MSATTTWGQLTTEEHAGRGITVLFPWAPEDPAPFTFGRRGSLSAFDVDGTEKWTHFLVWPGDTDAAEVSMRADAPVTFTDETPADPPATGDEGTA